MKDVITTLIPRYGELNRIYKDWFDNKGFSFEKQKFITKFYLDYNDVTVLETAILELVLHIPFPHAVHLRLYVPYNLWNHIGCMPHLTGHGV